jgi:hypothetical protein
MFFILSLLELLYFSLSLPFLLQLSFLETLSNNKILVDEKTANNHLKMSLRAGVKNGTLTQSKGQGASGSFKLGEGKSKSKKKSEPKASHEPEAPCPLL